MEEIIITTPDDVIDTIIKYGVTMNFMKLKGMVECIQDISQN